MGDWYINVLAKPHPEKPLPAKNLKLPSNEKFKVDSVQQSNPKNSAVDNLGTTIEIGGRVQGTLREALRETWLALEDFIDHDAFIEIYVDPRG